MHLKNVVVMQHPVGQKLLVTMDAPLQYFGVQLFDDESAKSISNKLARLADEIRYHLKRASAEEIRKADIKETARLKNVEHTESTRATFKPFHDKWRLTR